MKHICQTDFKSFHPHRNFPINGNVCFSHLVICCRVTMAIFQSHSLQRARCVHILSLWADPEVIFLRFIFSSLQLRRNPGVAFCGRISRQSQHCRLFNFSQPRGWAEIVTPNHVFCCTTPHMRMCGPQCDFSLSYSCCLCTPLMPFGTKFARQNSHWQPLPKICKFNVPSSAAFKGNWLAIIGYSIKCAKKSGSSMHKPLEE